MSTKTAADPAADSAVAAKKPGLSKKVKIGGLVLLIVLIQVGLLSFFLPGSSPKAEAPGAEEAAAKLATEIDESSPQSDAAEVAIGNGFSCTNSRAAVGATVHIDFKLVALVPSGQTSSFETALKAHEARVRQAIIKVARSSSLEDLNDPNLSTMKRLVREEINKILRKSYVTEVVISDFTTMEQ